MGEGSDWTHFQTMWAKYRALFVSVGLDARLVAEIDEIAANDAMLFGAHDTWRHRFANALERLPAAVSAVDPSRVRSVRPAVDELRAYTDGLEEQRRARVRAYVATQRGVAYCQFLRTAKTTLNDATLSTMAPFIPDSVVQAIDLDHRDAMRAPQLERRMRALAAATRATMETYYKPILTGVWTVSALLVGRRASAPPSEIGLLFRDLENVFWRLGQLPWPSDFIDKDAKFVRNAAAHHSVRFDPGSNELVLKNHDDEQRLTEQSLRQRLFDMFDRAETMRSAFLCETGRLDSDAVQERRR